MLRVADLGGHDQGHAIAEGTADLLRRWPLAPVPAHGLAALGQARVLGQRPGHLAVEGAAHLLRGRLLALLPVRGLAALVQTQLLGQDHRRAVLEQAAGLLGRHALAPAPVDDVAALGLAQLARQDHRLAVVEPTADLLRLGLVAPAPADGLAALGRALVLGQDQRLVRVEEAADLLVGGLAVARADVLDVPARRLTLGLGHRSRRAVGEDAAPLVGRRPLAELGGGGLAALLVAEELRDPHALAVVAQRAAHFAARVVAGVDRHREAALLGAEEVVDRQGQPALEETADLHGQPAELGIPDGAALGRAHRGGQDVLPAVVVHAADLGLRVFADRSVGGGAALLVAERLGQPGGHPAREDAAQQRLVAAVTAGAAADLVADHLAALEPAEFGRDDQELPARRHAADVVRGSPGVARLHPCAARVGGDDPTLRCADPRRQIARLPVGPDAADVRAAARVAAAAQRRQRHDRQSRQARQAGQTRQGNIDTPRPGLRRPRDSGFHRLPPRCPLAQAGTPARARRSLRARAFCTRRRPDATAARAARRAIATSRTEQHVGSSTRACGQPHRF